MAASALPRRPRMDRKSCWRMVAERNLESAHRIPLVSDLQRHRREPVLLGLQWVHSCAAGGLSRRRGERHEQRYIQIGSRRWQWDEQELPEWGVGILYSANADGWPEISRHGRGNSAASRREAKLVDRAWVQGRRRHGNQE